MMTLRANLEAIAQKSGRPVDEVLTHHFLEGVLRRVTASPYRSDFVLRGGMLTRLWVPVGQRIAVDVDFVGQYPFDVAATRQRFQEIFAVDVTDGITFHLDSLEAMGIWLDTPFPGARIRIPATIEQQQQIVQIDVGFGDPLVPPAQWITYPTLVDAPLKLQAVQPETMSAWKLHGLVEQGAKRWRAKDLYDLMLFATVVPLQRSLLPDAIRVAFSSRDTDLQEVQAILSDRQWWNAGKHRRNWAWYRRKASTQVIPDDLLRVVALVLDYWEPIIRDMVSIP